MKRYAVKMTTPKGEIAVQVGGILILGGETIRCCGRTHSARSAKRSK